MTHCRYRNRLRLVHLSSSGPRVLNNSAEALPEKVQHHDTERGDDVVCHSHRAHKSTNCAVLYASRSSAAKPPKSGSPIANADSAPHAKRSLHKITESAGSRPNSHSCGARRYQPCSTTRRYSWHRDHPRGAGLARSTSARRRGVADSPRGVAPSEPAEPCPHPEDNRPGARHYAALDKGPTVGAAYPGCLTGRIENSSLSQVEPGFPTITKPLRNHDYFSHDFAPATATKSGREQTMITNESLFDHFRNARRRGHRNVWRPAPWATVNIAAAPVVSLASPVR